MYNILNLQLILKDHYQIEYLNIALSNMVDKL